MTPLKKSVRRMTSVIVRDRGKNRQIVVTLHPPGVIGLRLAGTRTEEILGVDQAWSIAVKQRIAKERRDKFAEQKRKRTLKGKN